MATTKSKATADTNGKAEGKPKARETTVHHKGFRLKFTFRLKGDEKDLPSQIVEVLLCSGDDWLTAPERTGYGKHQGWASTLLDDGRVVAVRLRANAYETETYDKVDSEDYRILKRFRERLVGFIEQQDDFGHFTINVGNDGETQFNIGLLDEDGEEDGEVEFSTKRGSY